MYQQNHLYSYTDTCLSNVDNIYMIIGDKKKKLLPGVLVPPKVKSIFIVCKVINKLFKCNFKIVGLLCRIKLFCRI